MARENETLYGSSPLISSFRNLKGPATFYRMEIIILNSLNCFTVSVNSHLVKLKGQEAYFQSGRTGKSYLNVEWTNQHGCGSSDDPAANAKDCHMVLQYKCSSPGNQVRNGIKTNTARFTGNRRNDIQARDRIILLK